MSERVTPELLAQLAQYSGLSISAERTALLARVLAPALSEFRLLQASNYTDLPPAVAFRVPPPDSPPTR